MLPERASHLLKTFAATRCESAFRELATAYAGPVHAAARRVARGDAEMARDATQNVFAELARKPRAIRDGAALGAWLHRCAIRQVTTMLRTDRRRRVREARALSMNGNDAESTDPCPEIPPDLAGEIDVALDRLGHTDRRILTLRYWLEESWSGIAAALSLTEDAAQKRATRALEKMKRGLSRRGVTGTGTVAGLAAALSHTASPVAPAAVVARLTAHALSASVAPAAGAGAAAWSVKTLFLAMNTKAKLTLCGVAVLLTAGFLAGYQAGHSSASRVNTAAAEGSLRLPDSPPPVQTAFASAKTGATGGPAAKAEAAPSDQAVISRELADIMARECLFGGTNSRPSQLSRAAIALLGLDTKTAAELNQTLADLTKRSLSIQRRHTTVVKNTPEEQVFQTGSFYEDGGRALEKEMRAAFASRLGEERTAALLRNFPRPASEEGAHLGFGQRTITFRLHPGGYNVRADYRSGADDYGQGNSVQWDSPDFPEEFRGLLAEEKDAGAAR